MKTDVKKLVIFKRIECDIESERKRITRNDGSSACYNKRQQKALLKLLNLFQQGKWQQCVDLIHNKKYFPYNKRREYSETEHIDEHMMKLLRDMAHYNYYTQEELLKQAKEKLNGK